MHKTEFVLDNERHKIVGDFEKQTDYLILARKPHVIINKKKKEKESLSNCGLCHDAMLHNNNA